MATRCTAWAALAAAMLLSSVYGVTARVAVEDVRQDGKLRTFFDTVLDVDRDGRLTRDELLHFVRMPGEAMDGKAEIAALIAASDRDGDGQVNWPEFAATYGQLDLTRRYGDGTQRVPVPEQVRMAMGESPSEMVFIWVTFESASASLLQYGLAPGQYSQAVAGFEYTYNAGELGWDGFLHKVRLSGLQPSTRYYYRVGDGVTWSPEFNFRTAPVAGDGDGLRYLLFGDMGTIMPLGFRVTEAMVNVHAAEPYDMALHVGDISYAGTGSTREWEIVWDLWGRQVEPLGAFFPYMEAVGNHEKYYNFTAFNARFEMPAASSGGGNYYFSFDYGLVHFLQFCVEDYAAPWQVGSVQHNWMREDLARAVANRDRVPWIFVSGHRPFYGSSGTGAWEGQRAAVEPLLDEFDVDVYLAGHVHVYERSHPLLYGNVTDEPDAAGNYRNPRGPLHITSGTAGALVNDRWEEQPAWSAFRVRAYGFSEMTVHNASAIQFKYRSTTGGPDFPRNNAGSNAVTDEFWLFRDRA